MAAVAITQTANPAGVTADGSFITTYTDAAIGVADMSRIVCVVIGKEVATQTPVSVTIGGIAAVICDGTTFGNTGAWIYCLGYPTETTATIAITWTGAITDVQNHIAVYRITGAVNPSTSHGNDTSTDMQDDLITTGSTTIPVNGGMIAVVAAATNSTARTWTNLTEDIDDDAGGFRFTTATSVTAGTATRTCSGANNEDGSMAWAIFSESVTPHTGALMPPYRPR